MIYDEKNHVFYKLQKYITVNSKNKYWTWAIASLCYTNLFIPCH